MYGYGNNGGGLSLFPYVAPPALPGFAGDFGASADRLAKRKQRLSKRQWGLFLQRRRARVRAKLLAINKARAAAGKAPLDQTTALALAAGMVGMEDGALPPADVTMDQTAAVVEGADPATAMPEAGIPVWAWGLGGLAVGGLILGVYANSRKRKKD